jgi:hypothetical protein
MSTIAALAYSDQNHSPYKEILASISRMAYGAGKGEQELASIASVGLWRLEVFTGLVADVFHQLFGHPLEILKQALGIAPALLLDGDRHRAHGFEAFVRVPEHVSIASFVFRRGNDVLTWIGRQELDGYILHHACQAMLRICGT